MDAGSLKTAPQVRVTGAAISKPVVARIDELDGLRGILALWVALSHVFCWCSYSQLPLAVPPWLRTVAGQTWVQFSFAAGAVDTFIILSGFAISYMLHSRPQTYRQFMTGRLFRIYPVYLLCLLAGFSTLYLMPSVLSSVGWHDNEYFGLYVQPISDSTLAHPAAHLVSHLTLLFGLLPETVLPGASHTLLAPAWSISLEWQYYLLAPFLAWFARRPAGLLALGIISCGNFVYAHFWSPAFLPERLPLFLIGIGSYHLYANAEKIKSFPHRLQVMAASFAAILIVGWHWLALLIWLVTFGSVLADKNSQAEQFLSRPRHFLLRPALQFLGAISYPLYLVHWPVIVGILAAVVSFWPNISAGHALAIMLVAGFPIILFAAWILHKFVEKPLMQLGKRFCR
jgi:peptidoglycan/LPS O-acetylase OafA/YrhL